MSAAQEGERGGKSMQNRPRMLILGLAAAGIIICEACAVTAGVLAVGTVARTALAAGPDGIDLRPTPGAIAPEVALPAEIGGYEREECQAIAEFQGVDLGSEAVEAVYIGPAGCARAVAARLQSYHDAATTVSELAAQLDRVGSLDSHRLVAEEPLEGWWSASGKRNFVFWHAPEWGMDRHGLAWQSGNWCFIVASNDPAARRDVSLDFPY
jgi:hypothetical protein